MLGVSSVATIFLNVTYYKYYNFHILGTILSNAISGELIRYTQDWASVFYFFGALGIIWFILWVLLCYSDPQSHPFISDKEKEYLNRELCKYAFNMQFKLYRKVNLREADNVNNNQ